MIALDDGMMQQVQAAARALPPRVRENYLQTLSRLLEGQRPLSLGSVQRPAGIGATALLAVACLSA